MVENEAEDCFSSSQSMGKKSKNQTKTTLDNFVPVLLKLDTPSSSNSSTFSTEQKKKKLNSYH